MSEEIAKPIGTIQIQNFKIRLHEMGVMFVNSQFNYFKGNY